MVAELHQELGFDLREIDITGDPALEAEYRDWLPVVEIDGRRRFTLPRAAGRVPAGGCTSRPVVRPGTTPSAVTSFIEEVAWRIA